MSAQTMEEREREVVGALERLKGAYLKACEPYIKELCDIRSCQPPPPIMLEDGRVMHYVGPLPVWTPEGIKMP